MKILQPLPLLRKRLLPTHAPNPRHARLRIIIPHGFRVRRKEVERASRARVRERDCRHRVDFVWDVRVAYGSAASCTCTSCTIAPSTTGPCDPRGPTKLGLPPKSRTMHHHLRKIARRSESSRISHNLFRAVTLVRRICGGKKKENLKKKRR